MGRTEEFYGAGDLTKLFPEGVSRVSVPWSPAGGLKNRKAYDPATVQKALLDPHHELTMVDPRDLHATQPFVTRAGVEHYLDPEHQKHGTLFADSHHLGNQTPVIYQRANLAGTATQNLILSGHHRATTALLQGKQFPARVVAGGYGPEQSRKT